MLEIIQNHWLLLAIGYYPFGPLGGLALTLAVTVVGLLLAMPAGFLVCLGRINSRSWISTPTKAFIFVARSVPLIVQLLWAYLLIPMLIGSTERWVYVLVVLTLFNGAYLSEIIRGGINALPRGQYEAARSLGFSHISALRLVIFPQALRNVTPGIVSQLVLLIKETSLGAVIGMHELTLTFMTLNNRIGDKPIEIFILLGISYFILCYPLTVFGRHLERKFGSSARPSASAQA